MFCHPCERLIDESCWKNLDRDLGSSLTYSPSIKSAHPLLSPWTTSPVIWGLNSENVVTLSKYLLFFLSLGWGCGVNCQTLQSFLGSAARIWCGINQKLTGGCRYTCMKLHRINKSWYASEPACERPACILIQLDMNSSKRSTFLISLDIKTIFYTDIFGKLPRTWVFCIVDGGHGHAWMCVGRA